MEFVENHLAHGKSSTKSSKVKPLNSCLYFFTMERKTKIMKYSVGTLVILNSDKTIYITKYDESADYSVVAEPPIPIK